MLRMTRQYPHTGVAQDGIYPHMPSLSLKLLRVKIARMPGVPQGWPCSEESEKMENQESRSQILSHSADPTPSTLCNGVHVLISLVVPIQFSPPCCHFFLSVTFKMALSTTSLYYSIPVNKWPCDISLSSTEVLIYPIRLPESCQ